MTHASRSHAWLKTRRGDERLAKLVQTGRLTDEEAERLRAAVKSGDLDAAVQAIQLRHATDRVSAAVERSDLTPDQAQAMLARLHDGEDPGFLRGLRRRRGRRTGADG